MNYAELVAVGHDILVHDQRAIDEHFAVAHGREANTDRTRLARREPGRQFHAG